MRCCLFCHSRSSSIEASRTVTDQRQDVVLQHVDPASPDAIEAEPVDSPFTTAKSGDLRDIQTIFSNANEVLPVVLTKLDANATKQDSFAARLLKKFSRERRVDLTPSDNPIQMRELKREIQKNLLNGKDPANGGYDFDAPEIPAAPEPLSKILQDEGLARGRDRIRRNSVQSYDWPLPVTKRISASASPRRTSTATQRPRRSHSFSSFGSAAHLPYLTQLSHLRLPSFSAANSSKNWKHNVMESLRISSTSTSAVNSEADSVWRVQGARDRRPTQSEPFPALHDVVVTMPSRSFASSGTSVAAADGRSLVVPQNQHRPKGSQQNSSVHLYSMDISRRLRSTSLYSSLAQSANSGAIYSIDARGRRLSGSGFASEDVPASWGQVLTGTSSSIYSSHPGSAALSSTDLLRPGKDTGPLDTTPPSFGRWGSLQVPGAGDSPSPNHMKLAALPTNPSTSSLGKESRFKEELDISAPANKRNSMLGFFGYGHKKGSDIVHHSDGSCDERAPVGTRNQTLSDKKSKDKTLPRKIRLNRKGKGDMTSSDDCSNDNNHDNSGEGAATTQQLTAPSREKQVVVDPSSEGAKQTEKGTESLAARNDATGLMAKAIKATEEERMQFLLPEHKELGTYSLIRQRSSSFSRPVLPLFPENAHLAAPRNIPAVQSNSDKYLKPEFSNPGFQSESGPVAARERFLSVAVCPMERIHPSQSSKSSKAPSLGTSVLSRAGRESSRAQSSSSPISRRSIIEDLDTTEEPLGAWSRYPSHSRPLRTGSAGAADRVSSRDFAYEINPSLIADETTPARVCTSDGKMTIKRKNKIAALTNPTLVKGKEIVKHYGRFFTSTSLEYLRHGHGHRSSISAGGELRDPDLELLPGPPVWTVTPSRQGAQPGRASSEPVPDSAVTSTHVDKGNNSPVTLLDDVAKDFDKAKSIPPPRSLDGSADDTFVRPHVHSKQRSVSLPELDQVSTNDATEDATLWSDRYQSCVLLPPPTRSGTKPQEIPSSTTRHRQHVDSMFSQSEEMELFVPNLPSSRVTSASTHDSSDYVDAISFQHRGASMSEASTTNSLPSRLRHGHNKDKSMASIRQSSYDLLLMLKETEEKERLKAMGAEVVQDAGDSMADAKVL